MSFWDENVMYLSATILSPWGHFASILCICDGRCKNASNNEVFLVGWLLSHWSQLSLLSKTSQAGEGYFCSHRLFCHNLANVCSWSEWNWHKNDLPSHLVGGKCLSWSKQDLVSKHFSATGDDLNRLPYLLCTSVSPSIEQEWQNLCSVFIGLQGE